VSNVLIGIIGVILFIGLALAGALILGDDFKTATSSSQAAAVMSQLQQTQSAIEMWRLKTGQRQIMTQDTSFLVPRFLKTTAVNITSYGQNPAEPYWKGVFLNNDLDTNVNDEAKSQIAGWAMAVVGPENDTKARNTCLAIQEGQGRSAIDNVRFPTTPVGCTLSNFIGMGGFYVAYATFGI
jgi:hypothetical protein